jgi:hypothetical protein
MKYYKFTAESHNGSFNINKGDEVVLQIAGARNSHHIENIFKDNSEIRDLLWVHPIKCIKNPTNGVQKVVNKSLSNHINSK